MNSLWANHPFCHHKCFIPKLFTISPGISAPSLMFASKNITNNIRTKNHSLDISLNIKFYSHLCLCSLSFYQRSGLKDSSYEGLGKLNNLHEKTQNSQISVTFISLHKVWDIRFPQT